MPGQCRSPVTRLADAPRRGWCLRSPRRRSGRRLSTALPTGSRRSGGARTGRRSTAAQGRDGAERGVRHRWRGGSRSHASSQADGCARREPRVFRARVRDGQARLERSAPLSRCAAGRWGRGATRERRSTSDRHRPFLLSDAPDAQVSGGSDAGIAEKNGAKTEAPVMARSGSEGADLVGPVVGKLGSGCRHPAVRAAIGRGGSRGREPHAPRMASHGRGQFARNSDRAAPERSERAGEGSRRLGRIRRRAVYHRKSPPRALDEERQ